MITLLLDIKKQVDESKAQGFLSLDPDVLNAFETGYQTMGNHRFQRLYAIDRIKTSVKALRSGIIF
jgi:hypothetical protein